MAQNTEHHEPLPYESLSFEEAFQRLEKTALSLEAGNLTLDESTRLYEEGVNLAKLCNRHLNDTHLKITNLRDTDFDNDIDPTRGEEDIIA